jgi:hypothetical protein
MLCTFHTHALHSTRIRKQITGGGWNDTFTAQLSECTTYVPDADTCFSVAAKEIGVIGKMTVTTVGGPPRHYPHRLATAPTAAPPPPVQLDMLYCSQLFMACCPQLYHA